MNMYIRRRGSDSKNKLDKKLHKYTILLSNLINFVQKMCQRCFRSMRGRSTWRQTDPEGALLPPCMRRNNANPHLGHKAHNPHPTYT